MNILISIFKGVASLPGALQQLERFAEFVIDHATSVHNQKIIDDAVEKAKDSKNTSDLEHFLDSKK